MFNLIGQAFAQTGSATTTAGSIPGLTIFSGTMTLRTLIARGINAFLIIAGAVAVVYLVFGGIQYITAGGDSAKAEKGKTTIVNAIIGIAIIFVAILIVRWVGDILNRGTV